MTTHATSHRRRTPAGIALILAAVAALGAAAAQAQPFTDHIEIASHYPTLQEAVDAAGPFGMLIVDQSYTGLQSLVLPRPFRMVGKGLQGSAILGFDIVAGSAVTVGPGPGDGWVEIESLDIEGPFAHGNGVFTTARGIDLTNTHEVFLRNVTVRGFDVGVYGNVSFSLQATECNVSLNQRYNYHLAEQAQSWRIVGGLSSQSGRFGIFIQNSNDTLIDGVRMESNRNAAIYTEGIGTHVSHNRFECHVHPNVPLCQPTTRAVVIGPSAAETTLVANYYSGIALDDLSAARTTYRFEAGHTAQIHPPDGADALSVKRPSEATPTFLVDAQARVRIGPEQGAAAKLTVNADAAEDALRLRTGGITHLLLAADGQLGVGTASPTAQVQVQAGSGEDALLVRTFASVTPRLLVDDQGNVGVGTAAPAERLHVEGNIHLNGDLVSDGEICIGSGC